MTEAAPWSRADDKPDWWREPPVNLEAEQALLGAILASNRCFDLVAGVVTAEDFADPAHARIFAACAGLIERGQQASAVTLRNQFDDDQGLADVGGAVYLAKLQANSVAISNVRDYARAVHEMRVRRDLREIGIEIAAGAAEFDQQRDAEALATDAAERLSEIGLVASRARGAGPRPASDHAQAALDEIEDAVKRHASGAPVGLPTGLDALEEATGGPMPGDLIIVGARPSMGKTAFAEGLAWAAARAGRKVLFFSFEMRGAQLLQREVARLTSVPTFRMRRGQVTDQEFERLVEAKRELSGLPLFIDDKSPRRVSPVTAHARRARRRGDLDLVVVDYLQLMHSDGAERRDLELAQITGALKGMALDLGVPVLLLSQLNRGNTDRENRRPQLADLRESGAIEQDADVVLLLHRESYYLEKEEPTRKSGEAGEKFSARYEAWQAALAAVAGRGEVIVAKQRNGPTCSVPVEWDGPGMRYRGATAPVQEGMF